MSESQSKLARKIRDVVTLRKQIKKLGTAVALLNSMVLSGEQHGEKSQAIVAEALKND